MVPLFIGNFGFTKNALSVRPPFSFRSYEKRFYGEKIAKIESRKTEKTVDLKDPSPKQEPWSCSE